VKCFRLCTGERIKFLARNDVTKHRSRELNESARISGRAQHNFAHAVAATIALKLKVTEEEEERLCLPKREPSIMISLILPFFSARSF
jgi:hypothetical protein